MKLEEFLHNLHFDVEKASPKNWEANWADAPLPYKLYRNLPTFPLSSEVPLTLKEEETAKLQLESFGHFLWYVSGLTQYSQSIFTGEQAEVMQSCRRFIPSGGALYPNELYVYIKITGVPTGVYHYDVAHHRLVLLREGNFDSYIEKVLGNRCDISACFGVAFVSTMFWKNFFKYHNFAYRLQGLDAGVLIGQLLEVAKRFSFSSQVYFQFLDRAVNHLLGLSEQEESVYAVIPLSLEAISVLSNEKNAEISASRLCQTLPAIQHEHYIRSQEITEYPMLLKMNRASMLESNKAFQMIGLAGEGEEREVVALPQVQRLSYDLASVCQKRYSPDQDFILRKVSERTVAALLQEATASFAYHNDVNDEYRVSLYCCLYHVDGIPDGAYYYDRKAHGLRLIHQGDYRFRLQSGMTLGNVNLLQVPLCFHIAGDKHHLKKNLGYRGYRIQQMEAGMLTQRLLLAATALGMGGHPLLGFDANVSDRIYEMDAQEKTSLIQVPIGPYQERLWLRGNLSG